MWLITLIFGLVTVVSPVPPGEPMSECLKVAAMLNSIDNYRLLQAPGYRDGRLVEATDVETICIVLVAPPVIGMPVTGLAT